MRVQPNSSLGYCVGLRCKGLMVRALLGLESLIVSLSTSLNHNKKVFGVYVTCVYHSYPEIQNWQPFKAVTIGARSQKVFGVYVKYMYHRSPALIPKFKTGTHSTPLPLVRVQSPPLSLSLSHSIYLSLSLSIYLPLSLKKKTSKYIYIY